MLYRNCKLDVALKLSIPINTSHPHFVVKEMNFLVLRLNFFLGNTTNSNHHLGIFNKFWFLSGVAVGLGYEWHDFSECRK